MCQRNEIFLWDHTTHRISKTLNSGKHGKIRPTNCLSPAGGEGQIGREAASEVVRIFLWALSVASKEANV